MPNRPNILILMSDQQRADCLGCAGHPMVRTPNMDRLASQGMRFAQATTVCPICMPARASFANGLYPHNHGMWTNRGEMPAADGTFFQRLQQAGYLTAHIGKSHYYEHGGDKHMREREPYMHARGFEYVHETTGPHATVNTQSYMTDEWERKGHYEKFKQDYRERAKAGGAMVRASPLPFVDYLDSYVGRKAVEFVDACPQDRHVCLFVGFPGPHEPWDAPGQYATLYNPAAAPAPIPVSPDFAGWPPWLRGKKDMAPAPESILQNVSRIRANYYGKVSLVDYWFGKILEAFGRRGWLDNLLVVFWSDHGELAGDHGRLYKSTFHESSIRVPLILRWPGRIPAGAVTQSLAEIIDVFPTVLEAAGCEPSTRCQGHSLWPVLRDPTTEVRDWQLSEIEYGERHTMIRSHEFKYAVDDTGRGYMLYNLQADPNEQKNLIMDPNATSLEAELRGQLMKRLLASQHVM